MLQQYLPFTVLKRNLVYLLELLNACQLQQYLPFTVLKLMTPAPQMGNPFASCNSTYRLRY